MQERLSLNLGWLFKPSFDQGEISAPAWDTYQPITIPHTVKELSYNCFSHDETAMVSSYVRKFTVPETYRGKRVILEFLGVMARYQLYVNGEFASEHRGGYSRSRVDITGLLQEGENTLFLMVDSTEDRQIPPFGYTIDYMCFGGIYRDVNVIFTESAYISDVLLRYDLEGTTAQLYPEIQLDNAAEAFRARVEVEIQDPEGNCVHRYETQADFSAGFSNPVLDKHPVEGLTLWELDHPYLYSVTVNVIREDGTTVDRVTARTGFRTVLCKPDGFYLNGKKRKLVGLDRHQSYPYVGYAMPERAQKRDADILKSYLHVNTVRTSHYLQSEGFLSRCDEVGLLVFSEIPGWGYIGDEKFKEVSHQDIRDMITTQYNHPSIFIWSIRINESGDDDEFYAKSNEIAHSLDRSRPTTGVRCIKNSHLLEDVYSFNDFIHWTREYKHYRELVLQNQQSVTGLPYKVPYLVTEYCGHIYPVKPFDGEERQLRQAQVHARVQNANYARNDAMGAIGWCAFDYQTHGDYGSGDKICYHGVMDIFRMPKYAAYVYRSQVDPEQELVMEPCTLFARGENDDNKPIPFMVCTNCDYVEVECYGKNIGRFFPSLVYSSLPHPPIMVDNDPGTWVDLWQGGTIIGYYQGKEVLRRTYSRDAYLKDLKVTVDDTQLHNTVPDATRVTAAFVDQLGNPLPYYNGVVCIETSDNLDVMGPRTVAVVGGHIGFWVQTKPICREEAGYVTIRAINTDIPEKRIDFTLCPDDQVRVL